MRAVMRAALTVALLVGGTAGLPESSENTRLDHLRTVVAADANQESRRERQGRFQWVDEGTWTPREERLTYEWALERWPVPGGVDFFYAVGQCESGWNRFANNGGRYLGLFQHAATSWGGRVSAYMPRWLRVGPFTRWTNSRTQIIVTARMVNAGGWGPWTCA